jgi:hypothetical protein
MATRIGTFNAEDALMQALYGSGVGFGGLLVVILLILSERIAFVRFFLAGIQREKHQDQGQVSLHRRLLWTKIAIFSERSSAQYIPAIIYLPKSIYKKEMDVVCFVYKIINELFVFFIINKINY